MQSLTEVVPHPQITQLVPTANVLLSKGKDCTMALKVKGGLT